MATRNGAQLISLPFGDLGFLQHRKDRLAEDTNSTPPPCFFRLNPAERTNPYQNQNKR
jgi:hypothetical protein